MTYQKYNDYELVYMVQENDDCSYDVLFNKYLPIIKSIAVDYYKKFNRFGADLDDFIQESYLSFYKAAISYDENKDSLFYSFVVLCIHRGLISFCRRISGESKNISNDYLIDSDEVPLSDSTYDMVDYCVNRELILNMWIIVLEYPIEYSSVFELRLNQFKYKEISILLDIPVRRAQFISRVIQNRLRKELIC